MCALITISVQFILLGSSGTIWIFHTDFAYPVKVVEWCTELIHLFLANAFSITGQDLVLNFIDGPSNCSEELFPADTDVL